MFFNSFPFLMLVMVTLAFYYQPKYVKYQIHILIVCSFIFYAWGQPYLLILLVISASINAFTSYFVWNKEEKATKKLFAFIGVAFNLSILAFFKYSPLFGEAVGTIFTTNSVSEFLVSIPLPVGISFYTFQGISLVVDLYRDNYKDNIPAFHASRSFAKHYTETVFFISFFPQLVAGPIVKAHEFFPQIKEKYLREVDFDDSLRIIILGYFLKMVIADNLKDQTFWMTSPFFENLSSTTLIVLLFGYSIQIFSDFAGYSLIAIGVARLFGYRLPVNFNFPYIAKSFSEFWTRWHISLSTWLKEYLYFSLGGNKSGNFRTYVNLMIVMLLGGIWHGAAWNYMIWGGYHGTFLFLERVCNDHIKFTFTTSYTWKILQTALVFSFVSVGWLLFKLPEFGQTLNYLGSIYFNKDLSNSYDVILMVFIYSLPVVFYYILYICRKYFRLNRMVYSFVYALMLFAIITNSGSTTAFIYFQF